MMRQRARALVLVAAALTAASFDAFAQSRHLAPGFTTLPPAAQIVLMPTDIELFSISAGGVLEPKADWTDAASKHFKAALIEKKKGLGAATVDISDKDADEFGELNTLHAAIARSIANHHFGPGFLKLPTKDGKLDWSLGDAVKPLKDRSKADYALFSWIRDSYASGERVAAMVALALFGIVVPGGIQVGYASLIDLNSGQVLWFNLLARTSGDLRERDKAAETLEALLTGFPQSK
jgi:hypothetical protein